MTANGRRFGAAARGYDKAQVDVLCERIERTVAGTAGAGAITADEATNPSLDIVAGGYDHHEVEAWVRATATRLPGAPRVSRTEQLRGQ